MDGSNRGRQQVRSRFKTPEGRYTLQSEKLVGCIPFNYNKSTRVTYATLQGGSESGAWLLYNISENLHICRADASAKEATRSLLFTGTSRACIPACHAFMPAKDGVDLLVGLGDGQLLLLSLRTQLQSALVAAKPTLASALMPEGMGEGVSCTALTWIPRTHGGSEGMFAAAYSSGTLYVYKKGTVLGEHGSKFTLGISSSKNTTPFGTYALGGGGINDIAASPDGTRLAVACRDGAMRLVDVASGSVVGGYQSYYGAMLCCAFSSDGKYIAAGGEDDLVSVYGIAERMPLVHGEGHNSWVTRIAFDPWAPVNEVAGALSELAPSTRAYRLASVGQDGQLCLWDVQVALDADSSAGPLLQPGSSGMKKGLSQSNMAAYSPPRISEAAPGGRQPTAAASGSDRSGHKGGNNGICPALPRADMCVIQPVMDHRLHMEPLSDLLVTDTLLYTADHSGCIKTWMRPLRNGAGDPGAEPPA